MKIKVTRKLLDAMLASAQTDVGLINNVAGCCRTIVGTNDLTGLPCVIWLEPEEQLPMYDGLDVKSFEEFLKRWHSHPPGRAY